MLTVLSSASLAEARRNWLQSTTILQEELAPLEEQIGLLHSWIFYAPQHQAWDEVRVAADIGLALIKHTSEFRSPKIKGRFLWVRARAKGELGEPSDVDREWAEDLLFARMPGATED